MRTGNIFLAAICAGAMTLSVAPFSDAQPNQRKERREERKEERKERKEERKERKEERKENREERKETRKDLKEQRKEKRQQFEDLEAKEKAGTLTDDEKAELEKLRANHKLIKDRHDRLAARHEKLKTTQQARRRAARRQALRKWGRDHLGKKPVRDELSKHALRMARLNRLREISQAEGNTDATTRINQLISAERKRHLAAMGALTK